MKNTAKNTTLNSIDTHSLALYLSDRQIEIIRQDQQLGGSLIADRLGQLRDAAWKNPNRISHSQNKTAIFDNAISGLDEKQQEQLISSYAKMGYLYEIATLSTRDNYLESVRIKNDRNNPTPGGVEEFVTLQQNKNKLTQELVECLNQPVFEIIMTAHPTNVNSLESMRAQRKVALALGEGDEQTITEAIKAYQNTSIPPLNKDGDTKTLSVRDETENMLYGLSNIYEDLPRVYKNYDKALHDHATVNDGSLYDPTSLQLQIRLGSWGSGGDKDGNKNVTAETTLEAIALHTKTALEHYKKDIEKIPELSKWNDIFTQKLSEAEVLLVKINDMNLVAKNARDGHGSSASPQYLNERFDKLSKNLADLRKDLNAKEFEEDLLAQAKKEAGKTEALNLLRRFRVFGFNFGKIEYRETAKEYNRVVEALVPEYQGSPENRAKILTDILTTSSKSPADFLRDRMEEIIEKGARKKYSENDVMPIAYHTIKRMQLARDFGDMIKDNVLAECGKIEFPKAEEREATPEETKYQGLANILEAQFLQRAVEQNGKRAILGIVPLFEETSTMANVDKVMREAYNNEAHKKQLDLLKGDSSQPTQQIMIAHSDNARRSGSMAARAYIHEAHKKLRKLGDEMGINTQFYEGGSITDIYRNGVLAISKSVNSFRNHLFAKHTFQGGDLLAYFNHPASTERIFDRSFGHQAKYLEKKENGKWAVIKDTASNSLIDDVAIEAMKKTFDDYTKHDFKNDKMGELLYKLDYPAYLVASNISSRATGRDDKQDNKPTEKLAFKQGATTQMGAVHHVDIEKARTIGYSMSQQVAAILPAFSGAEKLEEYLAEGVRNKCAELSQKEETKRTTEEKEFLKELSLENNKNLSPKQLRFIYDKSPAFHNGQELLRAAYMLTDLDKTENIIRSHLAFAGNSEEEISKKIKEDPYWQRIKDTYKKVAELTYKSVTAMPYLSTNEQSVSAIRTKMNDTKIMKVGRDTYDDKIGYFDFSLYFRQKNPELYNKEALAEDDIKMKTARNLSAAMQATLNGRWVEFSDPTCRKHRETNGNSYQHA